jgi:hypothetical protein
MANETEFGLDVFFYSDIGRILALAARLECAIVGINESNISPKARWRDRAVGRLEGKRNRPISRLIGARNRASGEALQVEYRAITGTQCRAVTQLRQ